MPFGDGTGPAGQGPMTGRAAGYCAGYAVPGSMNRGWRPQGGGRGRGLGMGLGRGFRGGRGPFMGPVGPMPAPQMPSDVQGEQTSTLAALKAQAEGLQEALKSITDRISALETRGEAQE